MREYVLLSSVVLLLALLATPALALRAAVRR
jgi:hypothetical protein